MSVLEEFERAASLVERAMDDAYSRYLTGGEAERIEGVAVAIERVMESIPAAMRPHLLEWLVERNGEESASPERLSLGAEVATLKMENESLRAELADALRRRVTDAAVVDALLGIEAVATLRARADDAQVADAIRLLRETLQLLAESFLAPPGKPKAKQEAVTRLQDALSAHVTAGDGPSLSELLAELKHNIGAFIEARKATCREGAAFLLRELDPSVLEEKADPSRLIVFRFKDLWQAFERRYGELARDEDLYTTYFDPRYRRAVERLFERKRPT